MNKSFTKSVLAVAVACALTASVEAQTNGNPGTFESASGNSYLYHQYGDLYWMVTNSREGDPINKTWGTELEDSKAEGENGFYYLAKEKEQACPDGWRLPTRAEGNALMEIIKTDKEAKEVRWWTKASDNAFAGAIRNGGVSAGWETYGVWRLATGLNEDNGNENWIHFTMTIDPATNKWYTEVGSSKAHAYTVRCVKAVNGGTGVEASKTSDTWKVCFVKNTLTISGLNTGDYGAKVAVINVQGRKVLEREVDATELEVTSHLPAGVYLVVLNGTRNLTTKVIKSINL